MVPTEPNEFLQHAPNFAQPHLWDYWKLQLSWKAKLYQGAHLRGGMPIIDPAPSVSTAPGKLWLVLPGNLSWGPALPPCVTRAASALVPPTAPMTCPHTVL